MEAEGKTWNYHDILAQFITMHNKKSNVLLIWSGDWPTYSSNSDKYYVILAGEGFDSTDEAWNWCKANNYRRNVNVATLLGLLSYKTYNREHGQGRRQNQRA